MRLPKGFKSRTVWIGIALTVLGTLQAFATVLPFRPIYQGLFSVIVGVLIVLVRYDTHGSIKDKT